MNSGYSTPVPELDDHRHQSASVQKARSRRGTVDTMHSVRRNLGPDLTLVNQGLTPTIARDFEEAVVDDEGGVSPRPGLSAPDRSRRGTATTFDPRSVSPPSSVKAFAEARRLERDLPASDPRFEECDLHRTVSAASRQSRRSHRSQRSRRYTNEDAKSFNGSDKTAEEDVCFPLRSTDDKGSLQIDFELLENFIEESYEKENAKEQSQARVFHDLRQPRTGIPTIITFDGDMVQVPSGASSRLEEKVNSRNSEDSVCQEPQRPENRFEFFSTLAESTIHAPEFRDLILPGEDVQRLFTLPPADEENDSGVWWLNMNNPDEDEIRAICRAFGIHPLTIEDINTRETREKIELFPSYYFACFRSFDVKEVDGGQEYEPFNMYVVVFREGTLSFSFSPNSHSARVRQRITKLKDYVALSSDWICYALM